jgi:hypothetical protein
MANVEPTDPERRPEDDYPPTHRRWWRMWMEPGTAVEEWRELATLAEDLGELSKHLDGLRQGMAPDLRSGPLDRYARSLRRMSDRWKKRAEIARTDAIRDAKEVFGWTTRDEAVDWIMAREAVIDEDLGVASLCGAVAQLKEAERWLSRDGDSRQRVKALREEIEAIALEVNGRDPARRLRAEW